MLRRGKFPARLEIGALIALGLVAVLQLHASARAALDRSNPESDAVVIELPDELEFIAASPTQAAG